MKYVPIILFLLYISIFIIFGLHPYDRAVWYAENIPIVLIVLTLVVLYVRGVRFSNTSYFMMSVLVFMHTLGGHFTFERVPFDWFNDLFGFERNMYDRVAHFTVGLYAFPLIEYIERHRLSNTKVITYLFPLFTIAFVAMGYELIEWVYAASYGGSAGAAFLGSQGDIWDAQKDMTLDTLGAVFALVVYRFSGVSRAQCH